MKDPMKALEFTPDNNDGKTMAGIRIPSLSLVNQLLRNDSLLKSA
jgi:hypothetical protein